jgi:hypothetical protein
MSKFKYDEFTWPNRISGDTDVVDRFLDEGLTPEAPSIGDLYTAIEWLALYGAGSEHEAQPYVNVIAYLTKTIAEKEQRSALAKAKRAYAHAHGIPVSQVRVNRKETA